MQTFVSTYNSLHARVDRLELSLHVQLLLDAELALSQPRIKLVTLQVHSLVLLRKFNLAVICRRNQGVNQIPQLDFH